MSRIDMDSDLQRCYQRNFKIGMASMVFVAFAFALWVNSLGAPEANVTVYEMRLFITASPFDRKFRIEGRGESGNKIGISRTVIAQSGAGEDSSFTAFGDSVLEVPASSASYKELSLLTRLNDWGNVSIRLIDSHGIVDSTLTIEPLAVFIQRRL